MSTFGWIVLIVFALFGFAVALYGVCEFVIVQIRMFHTKIASELELSREDNKAAKELKQDRLEKERKAKHAAKTQVLNARLAVLQKKTDTKVAQIEQKASDDVEHKS
jgi:hypothetical protein